MIIMWYPTCCRKLSLMSVSVFLVKQVMLELAQLYLTLDDVEACQQQCTIILKNDPVNEAATLVSLSPILPCLLEKKFAYMTQFICVLFFASVDDG